MTGDKLPDGVVSWRRMRCLGTNTATDEFHMDMDKLLGEAIPKNLCMVAALKGALPPAITQIFEGQEESVLWVRPKTDINNALPSYPWYFLVAEEVSSL